MGFLTLCVPLLVVLFCSTQGLSLRLRPYMTTIRQTVVKGRWGTWGRMEMCPYNLRFASGIRVKSEPKQGSGDDTAANGVCISCGKNRCSSVQRWGRWSRTRHCRPGCFLAGWRQQVEKPQGSGDDTALNNVIYTCRKYSNWGYCGTLRGKVYTNWGRWSRTKSCPRNYFICGIQTRVEKWQGGGVRRDDTALNDIRHRCCRKSLSDLSG